MKFLLLFIAVFFLNSAFAHNGKIALVQKSEITIDGKTNDWKGLQDHLISSIEAKDFKGTLKFAWSDSRKSLFILLEIVDNHHSENDVLEFYINAGHLKTAPSNFMIRFQEDTMSFFKHDTTEDPIHRNISKSDLAYKIVKRGKTKVVEMAVNLKDLIRPNKTIGFDVLVIDADQGEDEDYFNWGKGYYGFLKEYNSGQLADLVLLSSNETSEIKGHVRWSDSTVHQVIDQIKISSITIPELWVAASLDSLGNFGIDLPSGIYEVSSFQKLSNPWASWGENNQFRINDNESVTVNTDHAKNADTLFLETYSFPEFLLPKKGILDSDLMFDSQTLTAFIATVMDYYNIPGASISVIKGDSIVYYETFGKRNLLTQEKVGESDVFQAASVTKPVFAFIVNRLLSRGVLELDTPLYNYLPFPNLEGDDRYKSMTTRHVLTHQSGLPNWAWGGPQGWKSNLTAKLLFKPGEKYGYSGEAFQYLGRVVEHITQKDLNTLLDEEVIEPLGVSGLYFNGNNSLTMVNGHVQNYPTFYDMVESPGVAHSLLTEAKSFAGFVNALLRKKGMSQEQYEQMFNTEIIIDKSKTDSDDYWNQGLGLGFFTQETRLGKAIMHGGSNGDFQSEFVLFPELNSAFVMFTNGNSGHKLGQALGKFLFYGRGRGRGKLSEK